MQVDAILNIVRLVCIGICIPVFFLGVVAGIRTQDANRAGTRLAIVVVLLAALLILGTLPLRAKIGSIITFLATYLTCALCAALLGGYGTGRKQSKKSMGGVALYAVVTFCVTGLALASVFAQLAPVAEIAKQFVSSQKPDLKVDKDCTENLTSLYFAFGKYAEYNDSLPPAENWEDQDDFKGAVQKDEWLHCPAVSNRHDNKFGYAYNAALSGRKLNGKILKEMPDAAKTPLLYDSADLAKNAHDGLTSLPKPGRHGGKNNILYCDGHIESVPPK